MLVLMAIQDRFLGIEVGYGLEAVVTDLATRRVREEQMNPLLKKKQYGQALERGLGVLHLLAKTGDMAVLGEPDVWWKFPPEKGRHWLALFIAIQVVNAYTIGLIASMHYLIRWVQEKHRPAWYLLLPVGIALLFPAAWMSFIWAMFPVLPLWWSYRYLSNSSRFLRRFYGLKSRGGGSSGDTSGGYDGGGWDSSSSSSSDSGGSSSFDGGGGGDSGGGGSSGDW